MLQKPNTGVTHFTKDLLLLLVLLSFNDENYQTYGWDCYKVTNFAKNMANRGFLPFTGQLECSQAAKASHTPGLPALLLLGLLPTNPKRSRLVAPLPNYHSQQVFLSPILAMQVAHPPLRKVRFLFLTSKKVLRENQVAGSKEAKKMDFLNCKQTEQINSSCCQRNAFRVIPTLISEAL